MKWALKSFDTVTLDYRDIVAAPNVFLPDGCNKIISLKASAKDQISSGGTTVYRGWEPQSIHWVIHTVTTLINHANACHFGMTLDHFHPIQIVEYSDANQGNWETHSDTVYGQSTDVRKLTISIQLSPPGSYEGGQFNLYYRSITNPITADRRQGAATVFRSHILHGVTPVTKGTRHSLVTWAKGPIPR